MDFLQTLADRILIADGAMGTMLYANGVDSCFEELNVSRPGQVTAIHRAYLEAGADVIQTNSYGANRLKLSRYGLEEEVARINREAVRLGKRACREAGRKAYVLGTIGGIRTMRRTRWTDDEVAQSFAEQLDILLSEGVDGLLLETYYDLAELKMVLSLARKQTELPIVAQVSMHEPGILEDGTTVRDALSVLETLGADVVGVNCRLGPHHMVETLKQVDLPSQAFLSAYPNAGLPAYQDGRLTYGSPPDYFSRMAYRLREEGVRLIGGCCGTTPQHIAAFARTLSGVRPRTEKQVQSVAPRIEAAYPAAKAKKKSVVDLVRRKKTVIVELDPPKKLETTRFFRGARALKEAGCDMLTLADNSLATPRVDNLALAARLQAEGTVTPLVHVACRDRNLIGLQSHLMGLHTLGIDHVLAVTGDPTKIGDFPGATSVYDCSSFELIALCKQFNKGMSHSGASLGAQTTFTVGAAFNPNVRHLDKAVRRMEKKVAAGADFFMTQPLFSEKQIEAVAQATAHLSAPVFVGIMPLVSGANAEFLHNEVPGMKLSDEVRQAMARHGHDRQGAAKEGVNIAKSLIDTAMAHFNGIYLITPFLRYELTAELCAYIREKSKSEPLAQR